MVYSWQDILGPTIIPGYSWAYNYSWIFLDLPGRTIIPGSGENHQLSVLWVYLCWFIFYICDAVYGINGAQ